MSHSQLPLDPEALAGYYAALTQVFRYPEESGPEQAEVISGADYLRFFDPSASDQAVSLQESAYVDVDQTALFEELVRFYEHFGLKRDLKALLPDHLVVQLEFMHFLCALEVHRGDNADERQSLQLAQRDFLQRHLVRLLNGVQQAISDVTPAVAELIEGCVEVVAAHCRQLSASGHDFIEQPQYQAPLKPIHISL